MYAISKKLVFCTALALLSFPLFLHAQGFVKAYKSNGSLPNLERQDIQVEIKAGLAEVTIRELYHNPHDTDFQGFYNFALPSGCVPESISLIIKQSEFKGEVLTGNAADDVYLGVFQERLDRSFLSMMGKAVFQARMYPVFARGRQEVLLKYTQKLSQENGLFRFAQPLVQVTRDGIAAVSSDKMPLLYASVAKEVNPVSLPVTTRPLNEIRQRIAIHLASDTAIGTIYSPTHSIIVNRDRVSGVDVVYGGVRNPGATDFLLYYDGNNRHEISANVLSYKPKNAQDGYFALLLSPSANISSQSILPRDIVLLIDASASMRGERLRQTKLALKHAIGNLNKDDKFNIIMFNNNVKLFDKQLVSPQTHLNQAMLFLDGIEAKGGANVNEALLTALNLKSKENRSRHIFLVTDRAPTVGITEIARVRENIRNLNHRRYRIHVVGIGNDLDTQLVDGIAHDNRGLAEYILPESTIYSRLATFFDIINRPVLSEVSFQFDGIETYDTLPDNLDELYAGQQVTLFGRYVNAGDGTLLVQGDAAAGSPVELTFPITFSDSERTNKFISDIWLTRKMGYSVFDNLFGAQGSPEAARQALLQLLPQEDIGENPTVSLLWRNVDLIAKNKANEKAIQTAILFREFCQADLILQGDSGRTQYISGRQFKFENNYWIEQSGDLDMPILNIKYGSEAYFAFLSQHRDTATYLALGDKVIFKFNKRFIKIDEHGIEKESNISLGSDE